MQIKQLRSKTVGELDMEEYRNQQSKETEYIIDKLTKKRYLDQQSVNKDHRKNILYLGPMEVFFSKRIRVHCDEDGESNDEFNKGINFSCIDGFRNIGDVIYWGVMLERKTSILF